MATTAAANNLLGWEIWFLEDYDSREPRCVIAKTPDEKKLLIQDIHKNKQRLVDTKPIRANQGKEILYRKKPKEVEY
jgi:hypothetical protein